MKTVFVISVILLHVSCQQMTLDPKTEHCIQENGTMEFKSNKYAPLQIVTGLSRYRLSIFGNYNLSTLNDAYSNQFLACSWIEYGYIIKPKEVQFDYIEESLKKALIREVGETGPGINLSKVQAKNIVDNCRNITAVTVGLRIGRIQNCIHNQILYLNELL